MTYEAFIFDMDGVLLTGSHTDPEIYREAGREALADFDASVENLPADLIDPDGTAPIRQFCRDNELPTAAFWGYREHAATALENAQIADGGRNPFPDSDALGELTADSTVGIVSNNRQGTVRFVLKHFEWSTHVDAFRARLPTLDSYDRMKPDPHYLEEVLTALDVTASNALYVGDRRSDIETAHTAGTDAALLARDGNLPDGNPEPTYVIESLRDLLDLDALSR